jgi:hypothetical protein
MKTIIRIISIAFSIYLLYNLLVINSWKWDKETIIGFAFSLVLFYSIYYFSKKANNSNQK